MSIQHLRSHLLVTLMRFLGGFLAFMKAAIYARVSTPDQQTLDMQITACRRYALARDWKISLQFRDIGSGAKNDRPLRNSIIDAAKRREIDVIIVWKLDRWGRSTLDLMSTLHLFQELGVSFVSITEALDFTTSLGKAMAGILAIFANFERDLLKERVKSGIAEARKRGKQHGRPNKAEVLAEQMQALWKQGKTHTEISNRLNVSRASVYNFLGSARKSKKEKNQAKIIFLNSFKLIVDNLKNNLNKTILKISENNKPKENLPAKINEKTYYAEITEDSPKCDYDREVDEWWEYQHSEDGVYGEYSHYKNAKLYYNELEICEEYDKIRPYLIEKDKILERGWNDGAIKKFLGSPNFVVRFKYYSPWHFWFKRDVVPFENKPEFFEFLERSKVAKEKKLKVEAEKKLKQAKERKIKEKKEQEKIKKYKVSKTLEGEKIAQIILHLSIENNNKYIRMRGKVIKSIKRFVLSDFDYTEESETTILLKVKYENNEDLDSIMEELLREIWSYADMENCFSESSAYEIDGERSW